MTSNLIWKMYDGADDVDVSESFSASTSSANCGHSDEVLAASVQ